MSLIYKSPPSAVAKKSKLDVSESKLKCKGAADSGAVDASSVALSPPDPDSAGLENPKVGKALTWLKG